MTLSMNYESKILTMNEMKMYNFIWQYQNFHKQAPTFGEIAKGIESYNTSNLYTYAKSLLKKKALVLVGKAGASRNYRAVKNVRWIDNDYKHTFKKVS